MPIIQSSLDVNVKVNLANNRILAHQVTVPAASFSSSPVKTIKSQFAAVDTLAELADVTGTPSNGHTLVYNTSLSKYVVQQLSSENINLVSIDGGTF